MKRQRLRIVPCDFDEACAFIRRFHRHHPAPRGHKFSVAVASECEICGVATVGRPVGRLLDDGMTLEVTRVATDGTANACSALYGACRRVAFALGYDRLITYTLPEEAGSSLLAAGFRLLGERGDGTWSGQGRPRVDKHPTQKKFFWEIVNGAKNQSPQQAQEEAQRVQPESS